MKTQNETWECKWCDWKGPTHELNKFGVHECCPNCRSIDVNLIKRPDPKDYGLNDVDYFQDCRDYEIRLNHYYESLS